MNNVNPISNISNFQIAQTKAGLVENNLANNSQNKNMPQILTQPNQANLINPSLMYDFEISKMDNETILKYLQNLLKMPKTIEEFIKEISSNKTNSKTINLLIENMLNTKALAQILNQNSTDAINKILQTISLSLKSGANNTEQLNEVLSILTTIQNNTNLNTNSLRELLLLYIPLNQQVFEKEITQKENSIDEKIAKNSKISILFETVNFSNILCSLNNYENAIYIEFFVDEYFPKEKFEKIILRFAKETNLAPIIDFKISKNNTKNNEIQNFKIITDEFIPIEMILLAHFIIKLTFQIDNDFKII